MKESKFRQWRKLEGLTLEDVSHLCGLSIGFLSHMERGQREVAPLTKVKISRALGVPLRTLWDPVEVIVEHEAWAPTSSTVVHTYGCPAGCGKRTFATVDEAIQHYRAAHPGSRVSGSQLEKERARHDSCDSP